MRTLYLVAGLMVCLHGAGIVAQPPEPLLEGLTEGVDDLIQPAKDDPNREDADQQRGMQPLTQVTSLMRDAAALLASETVSVNDSTRALALQQQALAEIERLLRGTQGSSGSEESTSTAQSSAAESNTPKNVQPGDAPQGNSERNEEAMPGEDASTEGQDGSSQGGKRAETASGNTPATSTGSGGDVPLELLPREIFRESVWGHLPDRMRGELDAVLPDQYLPQYKDLIESYYRRLTQIRKTPAK